MVDSSNDIPLLIVNPRSSGGKTGKIFDAMRGPLERALGPFEVAFTERGRHAVELARAAAVAKKGKGVIVAVGGDGTIHEVVNGMMLARDEGAALPKLGILGQGTGGDFRRTLGIEHRLDRYAAVIAGGKTRALDVGRASFVGHDGAPAKSYFVNILSAGIGGVVDQLIAEANRSLGGTFAYYSASVRGLMKSVIGECTATLSLGGEEQVVSIASRTIAVCNGRFFGSGMKIGPMAELDDGVLEVVSLGTAPKLRFMIESSMRLYTGDHIGHAGVEHYRCDKLRLELKNKGVTDRFPLDVDGEPLGLLPLEVEVVRGAIDVLVP